MPAIIQIQVNGKLFSPDNGIWTEQLLGYFSNVLTLTPQQFRKIVTIVKEGVDRNLKNGLDFEGNPVLPLAPSTIARKGHKRVFYDTGRLFRSVIMRMTGRDSGEVYISNDRRQIAIWLTQGTSKMVARPFFGISPHTNSLLAEYLENIGYRMVA